MCAKGEQGEVLKEGLRRRGFLSQELSYGRRTLKDDTADIQSEILLSFCSSFEVIVGGRESRVKGKEEIYR